MRWGIDLGGTKIEAVVMDPQGDIRLRQRIATPAPTSGHTAAQQYEQILDAITQLVQQMEQKLDQGCEQLGIGLPGSVSRKTGLMKNCNSTCLNGREFKRDIEARLKRSVRIANDANCFALSEASDGAAAQYGVVFGVILGTGVGGGLVVDKTLITGPNGIAGEWGHNRLPRAANRLSEQVRPCYCGRSDCVETYLSGPGLSQSYAELSGKTASAKQVYQQLLSGDDQAKAVVKLYAQQLGAALAQLINILDPDCIVLGGGLSNITQLLEDVPLMWADSVFSDQIDTLLRRAQHGDSSGVRGAAWLFE